MDSFSFNKNCYFFLFNHDFVLLYKNRFRPRVLIDVTKVDMTTTILGFNISMPIMIAPTGMQKMAHPEGTRSCLVELD